MDSIFNHYITKDHKAMSFFPYQPTMEGIIQKAEEIDSKKATPQLCNYLVKYNSSLNCGEKTLENIYKLREGAKVIMTGQQCGLLGGPIYSLYKALTAVRLAEEASKKIQHKVVPIFWIADEDHDWQEINHTSFLNQETIPRRFKINKEVKDRPAYLIENDSGLLDDLLNFMDSLGFKNLYINEVKGIIKATYDKNFSIWFAKIMTYLLRDFGLIFIDSKAPILKEQGKAVFTKALEQREKLMEMLNSTAHSIESMGYPLQNPFNHQEETNLFVIKAGYRYKLKNRENGMETKSREKYTLKQLEEMVEQLMLSPNVFLRPIIQDNSFPTIAYVGGPGEINYMAQIVGIYQYLLGEKLPVIFPRQSFMIIEPHVNRILKRYSLNYPHIHNLEAFKKGLIHNEHWASIDRDFQSLRKDIIHQYTQLIDKISTVNSQLSTIGEKNLQIILNQIDFLQDKTYNFHKDNNKLFLKHMEKLENSLFPNNLEQQRNLNVFYFIIKYHFSFIEKLNEGIRIDKFDLQYLEM